MLYPVRSMSKNLEKNPVSITSEINSIFEFSVYYIFFRFWTF